LHGRPQYVYDTRKGEVRIYGGKVVENLCQALARCVIAEQMLRIAKRYKPVLTVHDAVACVVSELERDEAIKYVNECMRWRPKWAETLPLACEIGAGKSYGDCGKKMSIEKWGLK
jgi:DNA polymerase